MLLRPRFISILLLGTGSILLFGWCSADPTATQCAVDAGAPTDAGPDRSAYDRIVEDSAPPVDDGAGYTFDRSWLTGTWDPLAGNPIRCSTLVARNPQQDVPSLQWRPCDSGRAGCRVSVTDWTTVLDHTTLEFYGKAPVVQDSTGRVFLNERRIYPKSQGVVPLHDLSLVEQLDGSVVYATSKSDYPGNCDSITHLYPEGIVENAYSLLPSEVSRIAWSSFEAPQTRSFLTLLPSQTAGSAGPHEVNASTALVYNTDKARWFLMDRQLGALTKPSLDGGPVAFGGPSPMRDGYTMRSYATGGPIVRVANDGAVTEVFRGTAPGRYVNGWGVDSTQNDAYVWIESTGLGSSSDPVVYTSPHATNAAGVIARRVTGYANSWYKAGWYSVASNGYLLVQNSFTTAMLIRLSDGRHWSIEPEPGMGVKDVLFVTSTEVIVHIAKVLSAQINDWQNSVMRIRIDTLGAGLPAE
jgi:hypothetical protein